MKVFLACDEGHEAAEVEAEVGPFGEAEGTCPVCGRTVHENLDD